MFPAGFITLRFSAGFGIIPWSRDECENPGARTKRVPHGLLYPAPAPTGKKKSVYPVRAQKKRPAQKETKKEAPTKHVQFTFGQLQLPTENHNERNWVAFF